MDDQPHGRGVYAVRRLVAVLVVLLLLALLVPQAYQALLGPGDETGPRTRDTVEVDKSGDGGSREEGASNEATTGVPDDIAEQEDASDNPPYSGETGTSEAAPSNSRGVETSEDEDGGEENIEPHTQFVGVADVFEDVALGDVDQIGPTSATGAGVQQSVEPMLPVEPIVPVELLASAEPSFSEDLLVPQDATYFGYPAYYDDLAYYGSWAYYDDLAYYGDWNYYEYPVYYEEQIFEESDTLGTYDTVAVVAASAQEDGGASAYAAAGGGSGAYAAAGGGSGAYAAISTG